MRRNCEAKKRIAKEKRCKETKGNAKELNGQVMQRIVWRWKGIAMLRDAKELN